MCGLTLAKSHSAATFVAENLLDRMSVKGTQKCTANQRVRAADGCPCHPVKVPMGEPALWMGAWASWTHMNYEEQQDMWTKWILAGQD
jgi:hypothetical protein